MVKFKLLIIYSPGTLAIRSLFSSFYKLLHTLYCSCRENHIRGIPGKPQACCSITPQLNQRGIPIYYYPIDLLLGSGSTNSGKATTTPQRINCYLAGETHSRITIISASLALRICPRVSLSHIIKVVPRSG